LKTSVEKIEKLFPSVYITLISILLGFAVEDVIGQLREIAQINIYLALSAIGILSGVIAAWIGYSFVSMTQERLPRVLDAVHVFFLAFGFYILNTTLGMEVWRYFSALFVIHVVALFATIYNVNILMQSLSTGDNWRIFLPNSLVFLIAIIIYPIAAWMSFNATLPRGIELSLIAYYTISNILWAYFFYRGWSKIINNRT
jgi:hypothetical protein